jgi:copper chaperone NosL
MKIALTFFVVGFAAVLLAKPAARTGPEPIRYDRDTCDHCRMRFTTPGFAAERRDAKGALRKYDDVGCMLIVASHEASSDVWVEDHAGGGFVPLVAATFVRGGDLRTPMNHGVVAFKDAAVAEKFATAHHARVVALEDLLTQEAHR